MKRSWSGGLLVLAAVGTALPLLGSSDGGIASAPIAHFHHMTATTGTSANWAGYGISGSSGQFSSISATWSQPSITCPSKGTSLVGFWVGIDGLGNDTVEQTGTAVQCKHGHAKYWAWYEMFPKVSVIARGVSVSPGDTITASVSYASGVFSLTLDDTSRGEDYSTNQSTSASIERSTAEVIAEDPVANGRQPPLADFGTVSFSDATVNGQSLGSFNPDEIILESGARVLAQPSGLTTGGEAFSVTWEQA